MRRTITRRPWRKDADEPSRALSQTACKAIAGQGDPDETLSGPSPLWRHDTEERSDRAPSRSAPRPARRSGAAGSARERKQQEKDRLTKRERDAVRKASCNAEDRAGREWFEIAQAGLAAAERVRKAAAAADDEARRMKVDSIERRKRRTAAAWAAAGYRLGVAVRASPSPRRRERY